MFGQGIIWGSVGLALGRSLSLFNNSVTWNLEYTSLRPLKRGIPACERNKNKEGFPKVYSCISLGLIWTKLSNSEVKSNKQPWNHEFCE